MPAANLVLKNAEVITMYYGSDITREEAEAAVERINNTYSGKQVEMVNGGQLHYDYIVSLER